MAWTPPRTWSAGEVVTSTMMNQHIRDNLNVLKTSIRDDGSLRLPSARFAGNGTVAGNLLPWGVEDFNEDSAVFVRQGTNSEQIKVTEAGTYWTAVHGRSSGTSANNVVRGALRRNGTTFASYETSASAAGAGGIAVTVVDQAAVDDYYTFAILDPNPVAEAVAKFSITQLRRS